eukprot:3634281-Amphidinium_carterae.1
MSPDMLNAELMEFKKRAVAEGCGTADRQYSTLTCSPQNAAISDAVVLIQSKVSKDSKQKLLRNFLKKYSLN